MLIPQFSLRWVLAAMTVLAVVSLFLGQAARGQPWAVGVSAAVVMLAAVGVVHGLLFFVVWAFSVIFSRRRKPRAPFAPASAAPFAQQTVLEQPPLPSRGNE